jgi:hypothetical protein
LDVRDFARQGRAFVRAESGLFFAAISGFQFWPEPISLVVKELEISMISNFEQVHNYYERLVFEEVIHRSENHDEFSSDMLADVACVALNRLPTRYVRHDVDFMFYLTEHERNAIELSLKSALDFAFAYVGERSPKFEPVPEPEPKAESTLDLNLDQEPPQTS